MSEAQQRAEALARDVLQLARNTLLVNLRFLDAALSQFTLVPSDLPLSTDGQRLCFSPRHVLLRYREEREAVNRDYLHMVFHCVFRHMYIHSLVDRPLWDLACDIAVEEVIASLAVPCAASRRQIRQAAVLEAMREEIHPMTAEGLYSYFQTQPPEDLAELQSLFWGDDHTLGYEKRGEGPGKDSGKNTAANSKGGKDGVEGAPLEAVWKEIARRMQVDMETFVQRQGIVPGALAQNLREVNRERYDYTAFLQKFAVRGEVMRLNLDEFDYIFYTYGLQLYQRMPLIEPLEYKEVKRIREFAVAIDTSGSVSGELVQTFVQKTYNVLKSTESFFSKINLHIIQCDAAVQEDVKITSQEEFDAYLESMTIRGLGGTDFRPVFAHVDALRDQGEFQNLKGLIYFTDGYGTFPAKKPDYDAAFVFVDEGVNNYDVPPWAIKLVLRRNEI